MGLQFEAWGMQLPADGRQFRSRAIHVKESGAPPQVAGFAFRERSVIFFSRSRKRSFR